MAQVEGALPEDEYEGLQAASVQGRLGLDDALRPPVKKRRVALGLGVSLHADTAAHGNDREGLARLCRYASGAGGGGATHAAPRRALCVRDEEGRGAGADGPVHHERDPSCAWRAL